MISSRSDKVEGYLYAAGGGKTLKIGFTRDPKRRMKALKTAMKEDGALVIFGIRAGRAIEEAQLATALCWPEEPRLRSRKMDWFEVDERSMAILEKFGLTSGWPEEVSKIDRVPDPDLTCARCGYRWRRRRLAPECCPNSRCHSYKWDKDNPWWLKDRKNSNGTAGSSAVIEKNGPPEDWGKMSTTERLKWMRGEGR